LWKCTIWINNLLSQPVDLSSQFAIECLIPKVIEEFSNKRMDNEMKMISKTIACIVHSIAAAVLTLTAQLGMAGSATWLSSPQDSAWENPNNWTAGGPPNGPSDVATFAQSSQRSVNISSSVQVNSIVFTSGANSFGLGVAPSVPGAGGELIISGTGIIDNSSVLQNLTADNTGQIIFKNTSTAGDARILSTGGDDIVTGRGPGKIIFNDSSTAESAFLIANGGCYAGAGSITFNGTSTGGTARVQVSFGCSNVSGIGYLNISGHQSGMTIGSIEGSGDVFLGANRLRVGTNNLSTTFSGVIRDGGDFGGTGGSLTKIGSGTLILSGVNTYTGDTRVNRGVLQVDGSISSNTVRNFGTLAGRGTVYGNVRNHGKVSPGDVLGVPGTLTVVQSYTQAQYANLMIQIAGVSAGEFSVLNVLGTANLNGFFDPVLLNGFVPTIGQTFTFLDYASFTGSFSHIKDQVFDNGMLQWSVIYDANHAILTVGPNTIPDQGSTFVLLTLGLFGLVTFRRQLPS